MKNIETLSQFEMLLNKSLSNQTFLKISLGNYKGNEKELKQLYVRKVEIKRKPMLSFNYRYQTRDIFKNFDIDQGVELIVSLLDADFRIGTLFTTDQEIIIEHQKSGLVKIRERLLTTKLETNSSHDKEKKRLIKPEGQPYLHALRITDADGRVYQNTQDKYKQINHYVEILSALIRELPEGTIKHTVDMGSGKGYLTFALYDYLTQQFGKDTTVTGVEFREDLVELCNDIANSSNFEQLKFVQGTIEDYKLTTINLLIALHACDTATDDAIYKGITAGAELIVVAPCCHKQIRREMEKNKVKNDVSFLTRYGIFLERQAEMVTDGIRALILELFGYKTKVFEFISDAHTPKNVLIVGIKNPKPRTASEKRTILQRIKEAKADFGIGYHHLEQLLKL